MITKSTLFSLFASLSLALPSGSPICEVNDAFNNAHGPESAAGYSISVNEKDGKYSIKLNHQDNPVVGVLLYVTGSDNKTHLGQFTLKPGFQYVDNGCTGGKGSTITHSNSEEKKDTELIWEAPSGPKGPFTLNAIVSGGRTPWQPLSQELVANTGTNAIDKSRKMANAEYVKSESTLSSAESTLSTEETSTEGALTEANQTYSSMATMTTESVEIPSDDDCIETAVTSDFSLSADQFSTETNTFDYASLTTMDTPEVSTATSETNYSETSAANESTTMDYVDVNGGLSISDHLSTVLGVLAAFIMM